MTIIMIRHPKAGIDILMCNQKIKNVRGTYSNYLPPTGKSIS